MDDHIDVYCDHRNKGFRTVEGTIHDTLYELGWIPKEHHENPGDLHWNRCSRTDKGILNKTKVLII